MYKRTTLVVTSIISACIWLVFILAIVFFLESLVNEGFSFSGKETRRFAIASLMMTVPTTAGTLATVSLCFKTATLKRKKILRLYLLFHLGSHAIYLMAPVVNIAIFGHPFNPDEFARPLIILSVLNAPLILMLIGAKWFPSFTPPPPVNGVGSLANCLNCGYDMRGSPGSTCPECGSYNKADSTWKRQSSAWHQLFG